MAVRHNISPGCLLNTTVVQRKLGSRFEFWDTRWRQVYEELIFRSDRSLLDFLAVFFFRTYGNFNLYFVRHLPRLVREKFSFSFSFTGNKRELFRQNLPNVYTLLMTKNNVVCLYAGLGATFSLTVRLNIPIP